MVKISEFRNLLAYLNPEVNNWLPTSYSTIYKWTRRCYESEQNQVTGLVQSTLSKIHFTVDLWTSPNKLPLAGIIGHYIVENGDFCQSMLGLREIHGRYTGENQALVIIKVIVEFEIASKLGYFMIDNATNKDTIIATLSAMLLDKYNIKYNATYHRLCYNGHIINLVAQAFLFWI